MQFFFKSFRFWQNLLKTFVSPFKSAFTVKPLFLREFWLQTKLFYIKFAIEIFIYNFSLSRTVFQKIRLEVLYLLYIDQFYRHWINLGFLRYLCLWTILLYVRFAITKYTYNFFLSGSVFGKIRLEPLQVLYIDQFC